MLNIYDGKFEYDYHYNDDTHKAKFELDQIIHEEEINSFMNMLKKIARYQILNSQIIGLTFDEIEYVLGNEKDTNKVIKCGVLRESLDRYVFIDYKMDCYLMAKQMEHLSYDEIISKEYLRYEGKIIMSCVTVLYYLYLSQKNETIKAKLMIWITYQSTKGVLGCVRRILSAWQLTPTNQENILKFTLLKHITGGIKW